MSQTKTCPYCAETIKAEASFCKHCKRDLNEAKPSYLRAVLKRWYIHLFLWPISLPVEYINHMSSTKGSNGHSNAHNRPVNHSESTKPSSSHGIDEGPLFYTNAKRITILILLWTFAGAFGLFLYIEPESAWGVWVSFMILAIGFWLHPQKGQRAFGSDGNAVQDRIKNYKKHKVRIGLTVFAFLFATLAFALHLVDEIQYSKIQAEREALRLEEQAEQEMITNYPEPTLEVLSSQGNQGDSLEYELVVEAKESTLLQANTQSMVQDKQDADTFRLTIPLNSPETPIDLVAKNEYKEVTQQLVITRDETETETEARLALEAEQEQERLEAERLTQEAEAERQRIAEEKAAEEARKAKVVQDQIIEEECQREWPTDFGMQNYCKKLQYDGIATLKLGKPSGITDGEFRIIRNSCTSEWPRDFQMRAYCEGLEFDAVREMMG